MQKRCADCNKVLTKEELESPANINYKDKICNDCMNDFCDHAITGD